MRRISSEDISYFLRGLKKKKKDCPYCGSEPLVCGKKFFVIDICRCPECGLFFTNPPWVKNLGKFYDEAYASDATLLPKAEDLRVMKEANFRGSPKDSHERLAVIRKLVRGDRLLEFGSSWGYFLFQARSFGFKPVGVEISGRRASFGRTTLGVEIFHDMESVPGSFDVICAFHTLEHLADLTGVFDRFSERLSPRGSLIVEAPNVDPGMRGKSVFSTIGRVHPIGFSRLFFEKNLPGHGFPVIEIAGSYEDLLKKPEDRRPASSVVIVHASRI